MRKTVAAIALSTTILLTGCGSHESKYKSEDEKLKEYSVNVYHAVYTSHLNGVRDPEKFKEAFPYIKAYKNDIDRDRLSSPKQKIYDEIVEALDEYEPFVEAAKEDDQEKYYAALVDQTSKFPVRVEKYFPDDRELDDYVGIQDLRD